MNGFTEWLTKALSLIYSQNICQRFSPSQISNTERVELEAVLNLNSGFVERSCIIVIYPIISNATVKKEHLHQIFRSHTTSNEIIQIIQLHIKQFPTELVLWPLHYVDW